MGSDRALSLEAARVVGVLNVTPDSFSDGGRYFGLDAAVDRALEMHRQGACMIDVGGESTRPGSQSVDAAEQIRRVVPVIEAIRRQSDVLISIDTTSREVARAALDAGADAVNDVSASRDDAGMFDLAAVRDCGLVLMHRLVRPSADSYSHDYRESPSYDDVVATVARFLQDRAAAAESAGIDPRAIVIDPGLGFGKTVEQNFELIARTAELVALGYPVLSAASRKSFIGAVTGRERPEDRVFGSVAVSLLHWRAGVRLFRVHDVAAHVQALAVAEAAVAAGRGVETLPEQPAEDPGRERLRP